MQAASRQDGAGAGLSSDEKLVATLRDCVLQATTATLSAICGAEPTYQGDGQPEAAYDGVVGIISFVGDATWSMMLGLPRATAVALAARFAGFEIDFDSSDMGDVVGELANVLAGDVSARLDACRVRAELSLPTVARGKDVQLLSPEGQSGVLMRFASAEGDFWVRLVTANTEHQKHRRTDE